MKLKGKLLVLTLPLLLTGLTGCGGKKSNGIQIKFWHTFGQTVVDGLNKKIKDFTAAVKEHDGVSLEITLTYQGSYDDISKKITDGYSVKNYPTIAVAYPDNVADYLEIGKSAGQEFVVNLEDYANDSSIGFGKEAYLGDKKGADDFVEEFYAEGSRYAVKGLYSLPYMKSTEIMFYNFDMVNQAMKTYRPAIHGSEELISEYMDTLTWDEFVNLTNYIQAHKADISSTLEVPFAYDSDANLFITKMYQNEIPFTSIDSTGKGVLEFAKDENRARVVTMLEGLNDLYHDGVMTTKGIRGTYGSDFFTGEKCVFSIGSSGGSGYNFPQADAFKLGVCPVPYSNNKQLYVTQGPTLALFNDSGLSKQLNEDTKTYAWKFMKYITNGEVNADLCINGSEGYVPVRNSAYETKMFQEYVELGENYGKCASVVTEKINGAYLVSDAFKGSANLRTVCGSLLTAAVKANKSEIPGLIQQAIDDALLKM